MRKRRKVKDTFAAVDPIFKQAVRMSRAEPVVNLPAQTFQSFPARLQHDPVVHF